MHQTQSRGKALQNLAEYAGVWLALKILAALPVDWASGLGGFTGRWLGPLLPRHRRALANLERVFPDWPLSRRRAMARGVWDNAGRVFAEYPHLERILADPDRIRVVGLEACAAQIRESKGGFLLTAHYGNWEVTTLAGRRLELKQYSVYRAARNPQVDALIARARAGTVQGGLLPKGDGSLRVMMRLIGQGKYIGMMVDQREWKGLMLSFLGQPAATVHAPALVARRSGASIFLGRATRLGGARFELECLVVAVDRTDNWTMDVETTTQRINDQISAWIIEKPEQWFWFHRRW